MPYFKNTVLLPRLHVLPCPPMNGVDTDLDNLCKPAKMMLFCAVLLRCVQQAPHKARLYSTVLMGKVVALFPTNAPPARSWRDSHPQGTIVMNPLYHAQLEEKIRSWRALFADSEAAGLEVFSSPPEHYRMRAEFRIWHEGERLFYAMFAPGQKAGRANVITMRTFAPASATINTLMLPLLGALESNACLRHKLYQAEFLSTLSGEMLVTLVYHRALDEAWREESARLAQRFSCALVGRSRGQKVVIGQDFVDEVLTVDGASLHYRQFEGSFTQPNAAVAQHMLSWARACAADIGGDLLELYCGNGHFTFALAPLFRQVLATEISKTSVAAARWGMEKNGLSNIRLARLSAQELTEALNGEREFQRLREAQVCLDDYDFQMVLVDPPRAGVDEGTLKLLQRFPNILYISCNPETLRANAEVLNTTHRISRRALFDQFPFTPHIESGILWTRRA